MNKNSSLFSKALPLAFLLLAAITPLANAQDKDKDTPLATEMKGMAKDFKQLKKQIADPAQKASSLDLIADMEKHVKAARDLKPANTAKVPAADQDKWLEDYHKQIDDLLATYDKLQAAVSADKPDEAKTILDSVQGIKRKGHEEFAKEEK